MYSMYTKVRQWPKRLFYTAIVLVFLLAVGVVVVRQTYQANLGPVSSSTEQKAVTVRTDATVTDIATELKKAGLIRQIWAFERYVRSSGLGPKMQAGTYKFSPSQSAPDIAKQIAEGKVAVDLVTILPGSRLNQIRETLIKAKFDPSAVEAALQPSQYASSPALADKPASASLEGFLYPESYQKNADTDPKVIIQQALDQMSEHLTPDLRAAFARQGLSVYQAVTLASVVEKEVSNQSDRAQSAQVFLKRLSVGMPLGSDVTAFYGAILDGQQPSVTYDSAYNTRLHKGLPPGPISNVSLSSLQAVANPAKTDWLYFVSGDDGNTYFSKTLEEHEALTAKYCHKLCEL